MRFLIRTNPQIRVSPRNMSLQTPLFSLHQNRKAKIVDFAGWQMPVQYQSLTDEYLAVRKQCGIFDVSHMGQFHLAGINAAEFLDSMVVSRIADMHPGQVRYTVVCNPHGGCKDDILVTRLDATAFFIVVNASNREKIYQWFNSHLSGEATLTDNTLQSGMIAIQGPNAQTIINQIFERDYTDLPYYHSTRLPGNRMLSRTGYTGEDGFEIAGPKDMIVEDWNKAVSLGAVPAGLGARDLLRLEMGYSLYGHELNEETSPIQAGLNWVVHLDKDDFIGKKALQDEKQQKPALRRIAFQMESAGIPRQDCPLYDGDQHIGNVTSGTFSPILKKGIGLALVSQKPENLSIEIRGKRVNALLAKLPFVPSHVKNKSDYSLSERQ
jgi:aminomethyltransferase